MAEKTADTDADVEKVLRSMRARLEARRGTTPFGQFAKEVGVAPTTLTSLMGGASAKLKDGPKALLGRAESVGRVYSYCRFDGGIPDISLEAAAKAFGLDTSNAHVRRGLYRGEDSAKPADPFLTQEDPTLMRIVRGEGKGREPNQMIAGALIWPPYCRDRSSPGASFAGRLMIRLLGSLHPTEWGPPEIISLDFQEILTPEVLKDGTVDAFFASYILPSRRLVGFDFIEVPGLSAPLGALSFVAEETTKPKWSNILDPDFDGRTQVYVVEADAGELLVKGSCGYPADRVFPIDPERVVDDDLIRKIAKRLLDEALQFSSLMDRHEQGLSTIIPAEFVFIADAAMVDRVHDEYGRMVLRRGGGTLSVKEDRVPDDRHCPTYRIGIAVSANSVRWRDVLADAMVNELFVNTGAITARAYADLLSEPSSIKVTELGSEIPPHVQKNFAADVLAELNRLAERPNVSKVLRVRIEKVREDIRDCWPKEPEGKAVSKSGDKPEAGES